MIELSQGFGFEAAHSLERRIEVEPSRRVHGHSYAGELVVGGDAPGPDGMLVDLGLVQAVIAEIVAALDHRLLDEIEGLGPGTMENLAVWIYAFAKPRLARLRRVVVRRDSLSQVCTYQPADGSGTG